jgi:hypothetical protein
MVDTKDNTSIYDIYVDAYWGIHDAPLVADVDVMTDASGITAFTRYTAAPSAISRTSSKWVPKIFLKNGWSNI